MFSIGNTDQEVRKEVAQLPFSPQLKDILIRMLAYREEDRPTMETINLEIAALRVPVQVEESKKPVVKAENLPNQQNKSYRAAHVSFPPKKK